MNLIEEMTKYRGVITESAKPIAEAWNEKLDTKEKDKGKWKGWTLADLKAELAKCKKNPNKTEALKKKEHQISFAIRAKQKNKWGKIKEGFGDGDHLAVARDLEDGNLGSEHMAVCKDCQCNQDECQCPCPTCQCPKSECQCQHEEGCLCDECNGGMYESKKAGPFSKKGKLSETVVKKCKMCKKECKPGDKFCTKKCEVKYEKDRKPVKESFDGGRTSSELSECWEEMTELLDRIDSALNGIRRMPGGDHIVSRAKSYWYANIKMALSNEHEYMGKAGCTMEDTISEVEDLEEGEGLEERE